jgi:hypothetical protein
MNDKKQMIAMLQEEFKRWEALLAGLSEEQISVPDLPAHLSIKDVVGHLRAWQQVSIARLEAALGNSEPQLPDWLGGLDPESEENLAQFNARIHETYQQQPWPRVYQAWRDGFLRFVELAETISEADLLDTEKYPWLNGYALVAVLEGSYEHHEEHLDPLPAWLDQQAKLKGAE